MSSFDVIIGVKDGKVKDVVLLPLDDYNLEYATRHAFMKIYGIQNVFIGSFEVGNVPQNILKAIVENPVFKKNKWIPFSKYSSPANGARVLVKMKNGYINIANYFYSGIYSGWKLDNGQDIDTVIEWRGLEEE
ncbi:MAG: hypothetical protein WC401_11550 [Bacteroidales bacterium]|jgi:hypothetical protein